ncbi:MAG: Rdx family protein [Chloroflexota bacterium]|nr:Rdx family protein [Chloroflexota bacterium]
MAENILHDYYEQIPGGVHLLPSEGGVFEVSLGDRLIFSKTATDRFPEENEVEEQLGSILIPA